MWVTANCPMARFAISENTSRSFGIEPKPEQQREIKSLSPLEDKK